MTEQDGEMMNQARMKALEEIALECFMEFCAPLGEELCKRRLEQAIEARAPGCGHFN